MGAGKASEAISIELEPYANVRLLTLVKALSPIEVTFPGIVTEFTEQPQKAHLPMLCRAPGKLTDFNPKLL